MESRIQSTQTGKTVQHDCRYTRYHKKMEWKAKAQKTKARLQLEMTMKFMIVTAEQD